MVNGFSVGNDHNVMHPTTTGWAVWWNGEKKADGLTHADAVALLNQYRQGVRK